MNKYISRNLKSAFLLSDELLQNDGELKWKHPTQLFNSVYLAVKSEAGLAKE